MTNAETICAACDKSIGRRPFCIVERQVFCSCCFQAQLAEADAHLGESLSGAAANSGRSIGSWVRAFMNTVQPMLGEATPATAGASLAK